MSDLKETQWLHHLYMQAPVAIGIYIGKAHTIELANPRMCEIWGRAPEQVLNKPLFEALPEVSQQGFEEILTGVLDTGNPFTGNELPATLLRNGKLKLAYFNILYEPLRDDKGVTYGIIQTAIEVTELVEARKKAERNEETMKVALEGGKLGTWYMDFIQNIMNRSFEINRIFGYEVEPEWSADLFFNHIHPDDRAYAQKSYQNGLKNGALNYEVRIQRTDKSTHWIHVKGKTSYNLKGQPIAMSGVIMDVTEQKQVAEKERQLAAEQAAREEEDRQSRILNNLFMEAPALICAVHGSEYTFVLVNPLYQQLFPGRNLLGKPLLEAVPELKEQPIMDIINGVYRTGETFVGNELPIQLDRHNTCQLETAYFNFVYQAMRNAEGNINGILVFAFEVTEQILARKRVESSEENLRIALEAGKMGTWYLDLINDTATRSLQHDQIFGYEKPLPAWGYNQFIEHVLPEDREKVDTQFKIAGDSGELNFEARIRAANSQKKWIAVKGKAFYENGRVSHLAGVVMDISESKQGEEKLKHLTEKLAASNEELMAANEEIHTHMEELSHTNHQLKLINADLDNFIYTASHDLKAPISNIEGLMKVLVDNISTDNLEKGLVKKTISLIDASVERFRNTIRELTDIVKLQKEVEEMSTIHLPDVIQEVQLDLQMLIQEAGVRIEVNVSDCQHIRFSYKNIKSIIYNLLSNAIKYRSPERSPQIQIACQQEGGYHVLAVQDNGLGIKTQHMDKIFSMFTRLHTHVEGAGVGLYLVKRIVDSAGGKLKVESEEGKGTTFSVMVPVAPHK